ncbi:Ig-like domain-containing protein [uncultured Methanobrevibacter sp.]|uniref:Ig-like domain-containing protein n=1 Tax=uncultured Methanobrevibacter sp. TaxID=253161 RepID=UPI0025DB81B3|nr:right-handed parallel beta-helix repeat-containing protein [uncultured Methanobrevibacter sp.]
MNSNKFIPMLGLLILLILAIGSISASEVDSDSIIGDSDANIDLTATETAVNEIDGSSIDDEENTDDVIGNVGDDSISDNVGSIDDVEREVGVENSLSVSADDEILASTIQFTESKYSTYFNASGNIIPGKLKAGDTLDFSGTFTNKMFIINIPLTITSTGGTQLTDCGFKFINGASGSSISNIKARQISVADRPIFEARDVSNLTFRNNDIFSNQTGSYPMTFGNVTKLNIFNNKLQVNKITNNTNYGQPSAMVFRNSGNCNISGNEVITNDSNGIYFTGYGGGSSMGTTPEDGSYGNYIFNNTVHSVREFPSSFCYGIQLMCKDNIVLNNTVYNTFRGISATSSGNQIIGNIIHNIHGAYYSQATDEQGADFAIYAVSNSVVKDNYIYDCNFRVGTDDSMAGAISAGKNSIVSGNTIKNCNGTGIKVDGNNVTIFNNSLNISGYGVHIYGNIAGSNIESNVFDSNNLSAIRIVKQSTNNLPHDIIIQNNTLYSTSNDGVIYISSGCKNVFASNNIIYGESGIPEIDDNTTHIINENNFNNYFSSGSFNDNRIKENDTIIFMGNFSSKGKLNINEKVTIQGVNAVFKDTTFFISDIDGVVFEGITIDNPNTKLVDRLWGIQISNSNNVTLSNCNISIYDPYSAFAIYVLDSDDCKIINNSLEAKGNYFTAALFSFNSSNLLIDGNSIKTIGSGETYLCNNRSCLNILIQGVTICPDGTIVCPDGTTYGPGDYEVCADGTIICPDGTTICADGTTICADGTQICPDGTMICTDGTTVCADGTIICADGTQYAPGEYTTCADGSIICPDGKVICIDGKIYSADECTVLENETIVCPDGTQLCPDGTVICTDGRTICADGTIICADGYSICPNGTIVCPDGTTYGPGDYEVCADGSIICPDGTTICPDGAGGSGLLDGVIPGTHMISGLFRTYGALFVHSSNVNFTNNNVNVSSTLDPFYKLNESCNTIAGVFIHYGGFNNTIANNNITLVSNDPVIYAIGIVGASSNSSAVGSKNNSFINNNVHVKGPYHGVGIYLGYKATNSTFANNISISAINIHEVVNRTLVENDENIMDNEFEKITPHSTALTVSDASFKWNNGNKIVSVTLKDINGNVIPNQSIVITVDGKNYTGVTDAKGVAKIKVTISKVGAFDVVAYFSGEGEYIASTSKGKLTLTKDSTSLTSAGKTYAVTATSKSITLTLKDGNGNVIANRKVTATVNGKTYTATTNSKGVATFKLTLKTVKTFTVSLKFAGDSYYTASTKSIKVKVTKTKTKLTVPKKTFKRAAKVKKITATLKDQTGKVIKSKKVTFTVNGKKYTAKTNKKGVATVKVKLSKKKTYKVTVKFAGDKTYYAVKKTGKVIIK